MGGQRWDTSSLIKDLENSAIRKCQLLRGLQ